MPEKVIFKMLNQFGICACCKKHGAYRNESYWCDACGEHERACVNDLTPAYWLITQTIDKLVDSFKADDQFWRILLGRD